MLNYTVSEFKSIHKNKKNVLFYHSLNSNGEKDIINLIDNFLKEKNSFIFESVEKGVSRGRYTIFGKNPDKIWEFNNNNSYFIKNNKKKKISGNPKKIIEEIIENFNFKLPKSVPPLSSIISGYFSYDVIRYIEKISNKNKDDLNIPDARLIKPRTLVVHDNFKKKIFYIINCFKDEKINNYSKKYAEILKQIEDLIFLSNFNSNIYTKTYKNKNLRNNFNKIKSNIPKNKFLKNVLKAKKYIKLGDVFQVVLSQRFEKKLTKKPLDIYKKLRITNPSPFMYFFNFNDFQIIGASPEILVRLRDQKVTIRPIAGTRPRGKNKKEDINLEKDFLNSTSINLKVLLGPITFLKSLIFSFTIKCESILHRSCIVLNTPFFCLCCAIVSEALVPWFFIAANPYAIFDSLTATNSAKEVFTSGDIISKPIFFTELISFTTLSVSSISEERLAAIYSAG